MIAVLVVDDSVVVRKLITDALGGAPGISVVGTAANGQLAQAKIDQLKPDVITMDIEMPKMNGIEAVKELRKRHRTPVIMFSTLSAAGASATLEALAAGATDYVTKPSNVGSIAESVAAVREQLVPKIHALAKKGGPRPTLRGPQRPLSAPGRLAPPKLPARPARPGPAAVRRGPQGRVDLIAVGSSTGGPDALTKVLLGLAADLPVPIVVTQHMPPVFTKMFAERLDRSTPLRVVEAGDGMELTAGTVYIAPGDKHLVLQRKGTAVVAQLSGAPPENSCRPAVDVMFRSVAQVYGGSAYAAVLTGMGHDGRVGAKVLRDAGAEVLAQDEASSVVWGMPGAVVQAGLADEVLPLDRIATGLLTRLKVGRSAAVAR
ncbi:chemotaxis response regulator protein-glutamate methylesterase [Actinoplanes sp. NBRC 103695]|uniref:protein-glutamate methylesterase/protein-glutamine glutaminase n=1 Tax=Actinoplanes sp. NBRC 103695 TaxID=3032202 RepID=UPI0024A34BEA|nr:chemotaxis response regulator protein-glutamate methylesterase [Actinoplanes sp. NBRC 103695]GLY96896.1 chemotaxis response regulator protein-glutamate methylesterase [Actinoplanes sp. NBRC 103695]